MNDLFETTLRTRAEADLADVSAPHDLGTVALRRYRRSRRNRFALAGCAAVATLATAGTLSHGFSLLGDRPENGSAAHTSAGTAGLDHRAVEYAQQELGATTVKILGKRQGGECLVYDVKVDGSDSHRVVFVKQGHPVPWVPVWVSRKFQLRDFVPDSDGLCGMYRAGAVVNDREGHYVLVGGK